VSWVCEECRRKTTINRGPVGALNGVNGRTTHAIGVQVGYRQRTGAQKQQKARKP
jgi:hypothetical protein